jgi:hypothetical protein
VGIRGDSEVGSNPEGGHGPRRRHVVPWPWAGRPSKHPVSSAARRPAACALCRGSAATRFQQPGSVSRGSYVSTVAKPRKWGAIWRSRRSRARAQHACTPPHFQLERKTPTGFKFSWTCQTLIKHRWWPSTPWQPRPRARRSSTPPRRPRPARAPAAGTRRGRPAPSALRECRAPRCARG